MKKKLVIVGNGPVAHKYIETLIDSGKADHFTITIFGEEPRPAYDRVKLTAWFDSRSADDLAMATDHFYKEHGIRCYTSEKITSINRRDKTVKSNNGIILYYDTLVLATGSYPFVPPIKGNDRKNIFVYRTIEDLEAITTASSKAKSGVVIGGGLLGLEAAKALHDLGIKTHVVEHSPRLMAVQVDAGGGALLKDKIEALGVSVHTAKETLHIIDGDNGIHRLDFADGEHLETDIIVFSAGIRPQDALARQCELDIGPRGGIVITIVKHPTITFMPLANAHSGTIVFSA